MLALDLPISKTVRLLPFCYRCEGSGSLNKLQFGRAEKVQVPNNVITWMNKVGWKQKCMKKKGTKKQNTNYQSTFLPLLTDSSLRSKLVEFNIDR